VLCAALVALFLSLLLLARPPLLGEEARLYRRVRAAQDLLWTELSARGQTDPENDTDRTGFIGLEWSVTTTTIGDLDAKRNACDPLWAVQFLRWFDELGLEKGSRVMIASSSSFPGLLYSALAAAEERGLDIALTVSLGASTWGANRPDALWPEMARILGEGGFLAAKADFYTIGGEGETGEGMIDEGLAGIEKAAREAGVELFRPAGSTEREQLEAVIERKTDLIDAGGSGGPTRLVISIGGSESNLGLDADALSLDNGLLMPASVTGAGTGVIGRALTPRGIPVLHLLNLKSLAAKSRINFEKRRPYFDGTWNAAALLGLAVFIVFLVRHRRWSWEPEAGGEH
jgi:poly-gamma-glutamate system protein